MQFFLEILQRKWHIWGVNQTSPPLPTLNIPWPLTERHFVWLGRLLQYYLLLLAGLFPKSMPRSRQVSTGMCVRKLPWHLRKFISFGHPVAKLVVLPSCERTTWPCVFDGLDLKPLISSSRHVCGLVVNFFLRFYVRLVYYYCVSWRKKKFFTWKREPWCCFRVVLNFFSTNFAWIICGYKVRSTMYI